MNRPATTFLNRPVKVMLALCALAAAAVLVAACGTQNISASKSNPTTYAGAQIFADRCAGCHTLSYAGTHGSASNVRTALITNGPNFNVRCERPVTRVLYAIENGGFSGAIMPQNVVVGRQAQEVAEFVATYAGRQAPNVPGVPHCQSEPIGKLPSPSSASTSTATTASTTTGASTTASSQSKKKSQGAAGHKARKKKSKP